MDGVILNSEPIYYTVQMKFFRELGIDVSDEEYSTFVGLSQTAMWERILKKTKIDESLENILEKNNQRNYDHFSKLENLEPTPGLLDFIQYIKNKELKIAVASSTTKKLVNLILEKLLIKHFFDVIVSGNEIKHGKPAPDIFLKSAELLNVKPGKCLVIEDSSNGVKAAKSAGMKCIGFAKFDPGGQDLSFADLIVQDYDQIMRYISES